MLHISITTTLAAAFSWSKAKAARMLGGIGLAGCVSFVAFAGRNIFVFGKIMQRLDTVEDDIKDVRQEVRNLAKRIDNLIVVVAQSGHVLPNPNPATRSPTGSNSR